MVRRRSLICLLLAITVTAFGLRWFTSRPEVFHPPQARRVAITLPQHAEPFARGRGLTEWLQSPDHEPAYPGGDDRAWKALNEIGTNAVPYLLQMLCQGDVTMKGRVADWIANQKWVPDQIRDPIEFRSMKRRNYRSLAIEGFEFLGPRASSAIPVLTNLAAYTNYTDCALEALVAIGAPATTALVELLDHTNVLVRYEAVRCLGAVARDRSAGDEIRMNAWAAVQASDRVVPALLRRLNEDIPDLRIFAMSVLEKFESQHEIIVPACLELLQKNDWYLKHRAILLLQKFHAREAIPALAVCLNDPHPLIPPDAALAIFAMDRTYPTDKLIPILVRARIRPFTDNRKPALDALREIDPALALRTVQTNLSNASVEIRGEALADLAKFRPDENTLRILIDALDDPEVRLVVASTLVGMGPAAKQAVPKMLRLLNNSDARNHAAMVFTIVQIAPETPPEDYGKLIPSDGVGLLALEFSKDAAHLEAVRKLRELIPKNSINQVRSAK